MKLYINGNEDTAIYDQSLLGELLEYIQSEKLEDGQLLFKIRVDGRTIEFGSPESQKIPIQSIQQLEIETTTLENMVNENIDNADTYLQRLVPGLEQVARMFRDGNQQEANQVFIDVVDGIDWFSQLVDLVIQARNLDVENVQYEGRSLMDRKQKLLSLTQDVLETHKKQDWVRLADLLEYEFLPYYQDWLVVLPQLKT